MPEKPAETFHIPLPFVIYSNTTYSGVVHVYDSIDDRAKDVGVFILEHNSTVRGAAKEFGVSKSTVHKDLTERLPRVNNGLYVQVRELLDKNKAERHIRGGMATRLKYAGTASVKGK